MSPDTVAQGDVNSTAKGSGARRNGGKIALSLVPFHLLAGCCRVFMGGKIKYAAWNWAKGMAWSACFDCTMRHLFKWWFLGEDIDKESGEHHLDHVFCNLFMLRHYVDNYKEGDDRPPAYSEFAGSMEDFLKMFDEEDFKERTGYATPREVDPAGKHNIVVAAPPIDILEKSKSIGVDEAVLAHARARDRARVFAQENPPEEDF